MYHIHVLVPACYMHVRVHEHTCRHTHTHTDMCKYVGVCESYTYRHVQVCGCMACEILCSHFHVWKNTFRWPRAYRGKAFEADSVSSYLTPSRRYPCKPPAARNCNDVARAGSSNHRSESSLNCTRFPNGAPVPGRFRMRHTATAASRAWPYPLEPRARLGDKSESPQGPRLLTPQDPPPVTSGICSM